MLCDLHQVGDPLEAPAHHHPDAALVQEDLLQVEQVPITEHTLSNLPKRVQGEVQHLGCCVHCWDSEKIPIWTCFHSNLGESHFFGVKEFKSSGDGSKTAATSPFKCSSSRTYSHKSDTKTHKLIEQNRYE